MTTDTGTGGPGQPAEPSGGAEPRCAQCSALLAPGISWCAQCYAPIAPARAERRATDTDTDTDADTDTAPADDTDTADASGPEGPAAVDLGGPVTAAWSGDGTADEDVPERGPLVGGVIDPRVEAQADQMLAQLGTETQSGSGSAGPRLGSLTSAMSNTGTRIGVVVGATVLLSALSVSLMWLFGQML